MPVRNFQELTVWQKAMDLVEEVYRLVRLLPPEERYALSDQMRRAAVSVPSNIAEGQQRRSSKEFLQFLYVAKGSNAELVTQLLICQRLQYLTAAQIKTAMDLSDEIGRMLTVLTGRLQRSAQ